MTLKNTGYFKVTEALAETAKYRASLESLQQLGRALLTNPSMEDATAHAFQSATEAVLEQASHEDDLIVVDGVDDPSSRVELIMQDVLAPRLTEVEKIEEALAAREEELTPVPFTTRDAETSAALESLNRQSEMLDLFGEHVRLAKTVLSMESVDIDAVRPFVVNMIRRSGSEVQSFGVSLESAETTQVLGELSGAVTRIEQLVERAQEATAEKAEQLRVEAQGVGTDGEDRIGAAIERHREENPSGAHLDEDVTVNTVGAATEAVEGEGESEPVEGTDPETFEEPARPDELGDDESEEEEAADLEIEDVAPDSSEEEEEQSVEEPTGEEEQSEEEGEEEPDDKNSASIESLAEPVVLEDISTRSDEEVQIVLDGINGLLSLLDSRDLLTAEGKVLLEAVGNGSTDVVLTDAVAVPEVAQKLVANYAIWINAALRDGGANVRSWEILLG